MVKCWAGRCLLLVVFPMWNIIVVPFAIWFSLWENFVDNMELYGLPPDEFIKAWKSWGDHKEDTTDAD